MKQFKNLISQTLARHGIEKEVASHQVVKEARAILAVILPPHAQTDIDVRSFRNSQLRIACLHPVALSVVPSVCRRRVKRSRSILDGDNRRSTVNLLVEGM